MRGGGTRWFLILLAVLLNGLPLLKPGPRTVFSSARFAVSEKSPTDTSTNALFREEFINPNSTVRSVHVASLCELPDGTVAATWYGGTREGARDVNIFFATQAPGGDTWTAERSIITAQMAVRDLNRAVRKVGNALILCDASGKLSLLYVTITLGGWSGSTLNLTTSADQGKTWTPTRRLTLSPFFNISELVKNGPTPLRAGGWAIPIYHELLGKFPEILWLRESGGDVLAMKSRVLGGRAGFQPAMTSLNANDGLLYLRDTSDHRRISVTRTSDSGRNWSQAQDLDLPNPGSGLDAVRLSDGRLLLAFNDSVQGRANLRLAISADEGRTWKRIATVAEEPGAEFSYPFLMQARDGNIHLAFTWKRKNIRHIVFNEAWLNAQKEIPAAP